MSVTWSKEFTLIAGGADMGAILRWKARSGRPIVKVRTVTDVLGLNLPGGYFWILQIQLWFCNTLRGDEKAVEQRHLLCRQCWAAVTLTAA